MQFGPPPGTFAIAALADKDIVVCWMCDGRGRYYNWEYNPGEKGGHICNSCEGSGWLMAYKRYSFVAARLNPPTPGKEVNPWRLS